MPSSPEFVATLPTEAAAPARWELADISVPAPTTVRSTLATFEVTGAADLNESVVAPARAAAQAAGYAEGWASGIRAARLIGEAEAAAARADRERATTDRQLAMRRAVEAVEGASRALEQRAVPSAEHIEDVIVSAAFAIAEALVGTVLGDDVRRGTAAVTRALALAPAGESVVVALSPVDHATITGGASALTTSDSGRSIQFVSDITLAPGDAVATSGATTIDARLSTGLARVRELLAPESLPRHGAPAETPAPSAPAAQVVRP